MLRLMAAALGAHVSAASLRSRLEAELQKTIEAVVEEHNVSFSIAVRSASTGGAVVVYAGPNDRSLATSSNISAESRFPMGSVTKSWTAAAIMQFHEAGKLDIDEPIMQYVDPVLARSNGTSMLDLWGDKQVQNITARQLMSMRAGLNDYADESYAAWTWAHPTEDWTPFDMLHKLNKSFVCPPGTCGFYASSGYDLLGLALVQVSGSETWEKYDQLSALPPSLRNSSDAASYAGVRFPDKGQCSQDPLIVHQYAMQVEESSSVVANAEYAVEIFDILDFSCLNGWTCGNIATPTGAVADWYWDMLHEGKIVSAASLTEMLDGTPLGAHSWSPGLQYGLGLSRYHVAGDDHNLTWIVGHGGADWGSTAHMSGYNSRFEFSLSVATNAVVGLNCSATYRQKWPINPDDIYAEAFYNDGVCKLYDAAIQVFSNGSVPRLDCTKAVEMETVLTTSNRKTSNFTCDWKF